MDRLRRKRGKIEIVKIGKRDLTGKCILFPFYNLGLGDKVHFEVVLRKYRETNPGHYLIGLENYGGLSMADYSVPPDEVWRITKKQGEDLRENVKLKGLIDKKGIDKLILCHNWLYTPFSAYSIDKEYRGLWTELWRWKCQGIYPRIIVSSSAKCWATDVFHQHDINEPPVTIHLRNQNWDKWKNLNFDKYLKVIDWIIYEHRIPIVLIGREEMNPKLKRRGVLDVSKDALTVLESAAIIERSLLFIGTDTGPTHLAAALEVPVVYTDVTDSAIGPFAPSSRYIRVPRRVLHWVDDTRDRILYQGATVKDILIAVDFMIDKICGHNDQNPNRGSLAVGGKYEK